MTIEAFGSGRSDDTTDQTNGKKATAVKRTALADKLAAGEGFAVAFGGQGAPWLPALTELVADGSLEGSLQSLVDRAAEILAPVQRELLVVRPSGFDPIGWGIEATRPKASALTAAAISLPGVFLTHLASLRALLDAGLDLGTTAPAAVLGHSQGLLAAEAVKAAGTQDAELLAIAQLIGAAASLTARRRGLIGTPDRSPMLAVSGVDPERVQQVLDDLYPVDTNGSEAQDAPVLAIRNGRRRLVLTGAPPSLPVCG